MKVKADPAVGGLSGGSAGSNLVFYTRDGIPQARYKGGGKDRWTPERHRCRAYFQYATRAWGKLTTEQCLAWQSYARRWFRVSGDGERVSVGAVNAFIKANVVRQVLDLPLVSDAPLLGPPSPPVEATLEPAAALDEFRFRVVHGYEALEGYALLVRVTPGTRGPGRAPRPSDARYVCGIDPKSAAPLVPSGDVVTFTGAQVSVDNGKRMGFEIRIVRLRDGMPSPPLFRDTVRRVE